MHFTIADVLQDGFVDKVKNDISDVKGIAYCVGSIDLKPLRMVSEQDFNKCMKLPLSNGFVIWGLVIFSVDYESHVVECSVGSFIQERTDEF